MASHWPLFGIDEYHRFRFADGPERLFLGDPGALENILDPERDILWSPVDDADRATDYDAIAVRVAEAYVTRMEVPVFVPRITGKPPYILVRRAV